MTFFKWIGTTTRKSAIASIRLYQRYLSRRLGKSKCRFEPSCSEYTIQKIEKYGFWNGGFAGLWRICRCNPFCECGHDPP